MMETLAPIIATVVSALVFAFLKWLGKQSTQPWHKWVIPGVTAVLAIIRMVAQVFGITLPDFPVDAAMGTGLALSLHQSYKGLVEKKP